MFETLQKYYFFTHQTFGLSDLDQVISSEAGPIWRSKGGRGLVENSEVRGIDSTYTNER